MIKILQINVVVNTGSTGRICEDLGEKIAENGWENVIAFGRRYSNSKFKTIQIGNNFTNFLHLVQSRIFDNHGLASNNSTRGFIENIKLEKPDIIHLHNIHGYYINYSILMEFLKNSGIPVVWTLHDCWAFTGHCAHYFYIKCEKWKSHCERCPQIDSYPKSYGVDNSFNNFEAKKKSFLGLNNLTLVPVSNWLKEDLKQSILKDYKIKQIYNGIDLEVFHEQKPLGKIKGNDLEGKFIILGVSNIWTERKGFHEFLKLRKVLNENFLIILVGLSKKQISSLPEGLIGIERTESVHELGTIYSSADVLFNPTFEDTFPTVNLESLGCGTPVITYNTGGSPEAIDSETGFVVEKGNINKVAELIESGEVKKISRAKCRARAVSMFNKKDKYEEYFRLYNRILENE